MLGRGLSGVRQRAERGLASRPRHRAMPGWVVRSPSSALGSVSNACLDSALAIRARRAASQSTAQLGWAGFIAGCNWPIRSRRTGASSNSAVPAATKIIAVRHSRTRASFGRPKGPRAALQHTNDQTVGSAFVRPWNSVTGVRWPGERLGPSSRISATASTFASNQPRRSSLGFSPGELGFRSLPRHANRIRGLLRLDCLRRMIEIVPLGSLARFSGAGIRLAGRSAAPDLGMRSALRSCGGQAAAGWSAIASPANVAFQAFPMRGISTGFLRCGSALRARAAPRVDARSRLGRHCRDWATLGRRVRPFGSEQTEPRPAWTATLWKKR